MSVSWGTSLLSRFYITLSYCHLSRVVSPRGVRHKLVDKRHKERNLVKWDYKLCTYFYKIYNIFCHTGYKLLLKSCKGISAKRLAAISDFTCSLCEV
jgi:hypothetical protein